MYKREGSKIDKDGVRQRESTLTEDWHEAQKRLRERLQARDNNTLHALKRLRKTFEKKKLTVEAKEQRKQRNANR